MCEKFDEFDEELRFSRTRTLKTQIFKILKEILCASRHENEQKTCILERRINDGMFKLKVSSYESLLFSV